MPAYPTKEQRAFRNQTPESACTYIIAHLSGKVNERKFFIMELAKINNQTMAIKEYKGQRVLTFKDIDTAHCRPDGTAGRAFRNNRKHFIEGTDFFKVSPDEFRRTIGNMDKRQCNSVFVITESGYLMLAKSFTDELAWTVQRELVNCYFRCKAVAKTAPPPTYGEQLTLETQEYFYYDKTYGGQAVLTLKDIEHFTGISADTLRDPLKAQCIPAKDYYILRNAELAAYKRENVSTPGSVNHLIIVTKSGFVKLMKHFGCKTDTPKCFIEDKKMPPVVMEAPAPAPRRVNSDECIVALNVLRYIKACDLKFMEDDKKNDTGCMTEYYKKKISETDGAIKAVGMLVGAGY